MSTDWGNQTNHQGTHDWLRWLEDSGIQMGASLPSIGIVHVRDIPAWAEDVWVDMPDDWARDGDAE